MKYGTYAVVLLIASWIHSISATNLRAHDAPARVTTRHTVIAAKNNSAVCAPQKVALSAQPGVMGHRSDSRTSKLRVCNAVTIRSKGAITVWHNGKELSTSALGTSEPLKSKQCMEYAVTIADSNKFEVKLIGQVIADWAEEKTKDEMEKTPILFLVASVFGQGDDTTFTVDEFHGEDHGLKQVQVAFMDVLRGAPDAKLRLVSPGGEFEMSASSFVSICAGEYSLHFIEPGQPAREMHTKAKFTVGEQYVVLRLTSGPPAAKTVKKMSGGGGSETETVKPTAGGGLGEETVLVYPEEGRTMEDVINR